VTLAEEFAEARSRVPGPTDAELIEQARWMIDHPDTGKSTKLILGALLSEIDRLKLRARHLAGFKLV